MRKIFKSWAKWAQSTLWYLRLCLRRYFYILPIMNILYCKWFSYKLIIPRHMVSAKYLRKWEDYYFCVGEGGYFRATDEVIFLVSIGCLFYEVKAILRIVVLFSDLLLIQMLFSTYSYIILWIFYVYCQYCDHSQ